jgi:Protein of unknown function (DUF3168)
MIDPSLELQEALKVLLRGNIGGDVGLRVYDQVPEVATFPYVTIGDDQVLPDKDQCIDGAEVFSTLHIWSRTTGFPQTKQIIKNILAVLDDKPPSLNGGFRCIVFEIQDINYLRDPDGLTRHGVMTFRSLIQPS